MMRFLKSTLFPSSSPLDHERVQLEEIKILKKRVELLEEENKKSSTAIQELSNCVKSLSIIIAEMSADMSSLTSYVSSMRAPSHEDDIISRYLSNIDDDDDGYLN